MSLFSWFKDSPQRIQQRQNNLPNCVPTDLHNCDVWPIAKAPTTYAEIQNKKGFQARQTRLQTQNQSVVVIKNLFGAK